MQTKTYPAPVLLLAGAGAAAGVLLLKKLATQPKPLQLHGKAVVITGGSRGLGLALAQEFGKAGALLTLAARDAEELQRAKNVLASASLSPDCRIELFAGDLRDQATCGRLIASATQTFGRVDILINNAGIIHVGPIEKQPLQAFSDAMATDFFAAVQLTSAVLPQMLARGEGSIVNIASVAGKVPVPHLAPYTAAKFATVGYSGVLNAELRAKGIRVTTVCPGLMRTGSYPNAIVVGDLEREYRWFSLAASLPGLSHSCAGAARKILEATVAGKSEISIGIDAYLAARFYGLLPEAASALASLADQLLLPATTGTTQPTPARRIRAPRWTWWRSLSRSLTQTQNQPAA